MNIKIPAQAELGRGTRRLGGGFSPLELERRLFSLCLPRVLLDL